MGLDDDLCRQAKELYRWEVQFSGEYYSSEVMDICPWLDERETPIIGIGRDAPNLDHTNQTRYSFVDQNCQTLYQPFAITHLGREHDYQEDLVRAALLYLRKEYSEKPLVLSFPTALRDHVRSHHLVLLNQHNPEVQEFSRRIVRIFIPYNPDSQVEVLRDIRVDPLNSDTLV